MRQELTPAERSELAQVFPGGDSARALLANAGFPLEHIPLGSSTAASFWAAVSTALGDGILLNGRARLLAAARELYPANDVFAPAARAGTGGPEALENPSGPVGGEPPLDFELRNAELVVHLFAPADGPRAASAYAVLSSAWEGCRSALAMRSPVPSLRVPTVPPAALSDVRLNGFLAAARRTGDGVLEAVLRRDHDLVHLSVMLAPADVGPFDWSALDALWDRAVGAASADLLGAVRVYQGKVAPGAADGSVEASAALARGCREALPVGSRGNGWEEHGTTTGSGFAVWDLDGADGKVERRIVVLATADRDRDLSHYTWARADQAVPHLTVYLANAARIRYHHRVRTEAPPMARLRDRMDDDIDRLGSALMRSGQAGPDVRTELARLAVTELRLTKTKRKHDDMRGSVQTAVENLGKVLREDGSAAGTTDLFAADLRLAADLMAQLDHDGAFLARAMGQMASARSLAAGVKDAFNT